MSLIPYLYSAFATYHFKGIPPFRALVVDYPQDSAVYKIDDQYMLAKPVQYITPETVFEINCHTYGNICNPAQLFEDNSYTLNYQKNQFNCYRLD